MTKRQMKAYKKRLNNVKDKFEIIKNRNGCNLVVDRNESDHTKKLMEEVKNSMEFYAIDGLFYEHGDVVDVVDSGLMTTFAIKNSDNPNSPVKYLETFTSNVDKLREFFINNNFSSYEAFKHNLLPSYNIPDGACFVGTQWEGIFFGVKFTIKYIHVKTFA